MKRLWNKYTDLFGETIFHPQFLILRNNKISIWESLKYIRRFNKKVRLIDIGCGRMPYREKLENYVSEYVGVDHPKSSKLYLGTKFRPEVLADAHNLPFANKTFDIALMLEVLEDFEDPQKTLCEAARVLKRNGILILLAPFMYPRQDAPFDRLRFTDTQLRSMVKIARLKTIRIIPQGGFMEFYILSFLVFWFKSIMYFLSKKLIYKLVGIVMLGLSPFFVIGGNIFALLFKNLTKFSSADADFVINYLVIAKNV